TAAAVVTWALPERAGTFGEMFATFALIARAEWLIRPLVWLGIPINFRIARTIVGVPVVVFALTAVWGISRRRWRRLALLTAVVPVVTVGAGIWLLQVDDRLFDPAQYYDWRDWYMVLGHGPYF